MKKTILISLFTALLGPSLALASYEESETPSFPMSHCLAESSNEDSEYRIETERGDLYFLTKESCQQAHSVLQSRFAEGEISAYVYGCTYRAYLDTASDPWDSVSNHIGSTLRLARSILGAGSTLTLVGYSVDDDGEVHLSKMPWSTNYSFKDDRYAKACTKAATKNYGSYFEYRAGF